MAVNNVRVVKLAVDDSCGKGLLFIRAEVLRCIILIVGGVVR